MSQSRSITCLAVELENDAQNAVRRRMLRAHVQHHFWAVEQRFSGGGDLYLVHIWLVVSVQ